MSALAALGAVWYARELGKAADRVAASAKESAAASVKSASAAETVVALDRSRRHEQLTPQFRVTVVRKPQFKFERNFEYMMTVYLVGPHELGQLDSLTIRIQDDRPGRAEGPLMPGGPSREELAAQVWGPRRFVPGTGSFSDPVGTGNVADATGRVMPTSGLPVGEQLEFALEATKPPPWVSWLKDQFADIRWREEVGEHLRIKLECSREGWDDWTLTGRVYTSNFSATVEIPAGAADREKSKRMSSSL